MTVATGGGGVTGGRVGSGARLKVGNGGTVKVGSGANVKVGGGANVKVGIGSKLMLGGGGTAAAGAGPADCTGGRVGKSSEIGGNEYATVGIGVERGVGMDAGALVPEVVRALTALGEGVCLARVELRVLPSKAAAAMTVDMLKRKTTTHPMTAVERLADPSIGARVRTPRTSDIRNARPKPTAAIATKLVEPVDREPSRKKVISR